MTESQTGPADDHLFVTLITDLVTQAWVSLGKIKHPATDRLERNIPAVSMIIDMLDMLNRKTAGNRSEMEDRLLLDSLQQLKINYVAEVDKPEQPTPGAAPAETNEASGSADPEGAAKKSPEEKAKSTQPPRKSSKSNDT